MRNWFFNFLLICLCCFVTVAEAQHLSIIVHKDNPVQVVSDKDLINYFLKTKRSWPHGLKVNPIDLLLSTPEKKLFLRSVLQLSESEWQAQWTKAKETKFILPPMLVTNTRQAIDLVAFDKSAIAYVFSQDLSAQDLQRVNVVRTLEE